MKSCTSTFSGILCLLLPSGVSRIQKNSKLFNINNCSSWNIIKNRPNHVTGIMLKSLRINAAPSGVGNAKIYRPRPMEEA